MLLEAVNFPQASRGGPGGVSKADRAGFAVGSKKFRGAAGQPGAHPPTRADARLRGPSGDLAGTRTCGRPDTQDPRRGGCFAVRSGAEQREKIGKTEPFG